MRFFGSRKGYETFRRDSSNNNRADKPGCCQGAMNSSLADLRSAYFWRGIVAEAMGVFFLVLLGCGSCVNVSDLTPSPSELQIALTFGFGAATLVGATAHMSGGYLNPAVTLAMLVGRKISLIKALLYIIAQCSGAIAGAGILKVLTPETQMNMLGVTLVSPYLKIVQALFIESFITFVLVITVFTMNDEKRLEYLRDNAPLAHGLAVTLCHLFAIKYTGSSMNPARSLGPALMMWLWTDHWIYWIGPMMGAVVAALLYETFFAANASAAKARAFCLQRDYNSDDFEPIPDGRQLLSAREELDATFDG